jgi:hypothetical protein
LQLYEYFSGNIGTTIRWEWLPRDVDPRPYTGPDFIGLTPAVKALSGEAEGARVEAGAASQQWEIDVSSETAVVALPLYYWPGWRASVDGQPAELGAEPGLGWARLEVPRGEHTVTLSLGRTPLRAASEWFSVLAALVTLVLLRRERLAPYRRALGVAFIAIAVCWVGLRLLPGAEPIDGPLTMDFAQQAYPYHAVDGLPLENGAHVEDLDAGPGAATALTLPAANVLDIPLSLDDETSLSPGVYLRTWTFTDEQGEPLAALTGAGEPRGTLTSLALTENTRSWAGPDDVPVVTLAPGLGLLDAAFTEAGNLQLRWRVDAEQPRNYHIALRLRDVAGNSWAEQDAPLGMYGAYPPSLWQPGELVTEYYTLSIHDGMPPSDDYRLYVAVYDSATGETAGDAEIGGLAWRGYTPAPDAAPQFAYVTPEISIYRLVSTNQLGSLTQGRKLRVWVYWVAEQAPAVNYRARWSLVDEDGAEAWSADTALAPGSPPMMWRAGQFVTGGLALDPPASLTPGVYTLMLQMLDDVGEPVSDPLDLGALTLEAASVPTGEPDDVPNRVDADFGGLVRFWGYDAQRTDDKLTLTLMWGALDETTVDYTFFVHLFDPQTEAIPVQVDTMPHHYTYPTSVWIPGEIVTDEVTLDLSDAPPGVYRLAVGWYDAESRLPAVDAAGARLPSDRVVLPLEVEVAAP